MIRYGKRFWDIKHASFNVVLVLVVFFYHIHVNQIVQNDWENREYIAAHCLNRCFSISVCNTYTYGWCVCVCSKKPYWPFKINDFCLVFWLLLSQFDCLVFFLFVVVFFPYLLIVLVFHNPFVHVCACVCFVVILAISSYCSLCVRERVQNHSLKQFIWF